MSVLSRLFAEKVDKKEKLDYKQLGSTGVEFFSGLITSEEYLSDFQGSKKFAVYDKMRKGDAQVKGVLTSLKLPIKEAKWYIESAGDDSKNKEIAEFIENNLFNWMNITFDSFLHNCLTFLDMGFSLFEKVWARPIPKTGNKIWLKNLAPRLQRTVYEWYRDEEGGFGGIKQYTQTTDGKFSYIDIPPEKLILFTNEQEGSNFEGVSVLRSAYKHWYIKDELYKIDATAHDRFASGVPWAKEPDSSNQADINRVATILENLQSRERSYMTIPKGWEMGIFEKTSGNDAIYNSIKHHNEEIAKNVLAQFINLGTTESGSRSLGESFEELFLMSLNAVASQIEDAINKYLIPQMVIYNWNGVSEYPKLKHARIMLSSKRYMESIKTGTDAGIITPDSELEDTVRDILGLPMKPEGEETEEQVPDNKVPEKTANNSTTDKEESSKPEETPEEDSTLHDCGHNHVMLAQPRPPTKLEEMILDISGITKTLDDGVAAVEREILKIRKQMAKVVANEIVNKKADDVKVPYIGKLADRLYDKAKIMYKKGKSEIKKEMSKQFSLLGKSKLLEEPQTIGDVEESEDEDKAALQHLKDRSKSDSVIVGNALLSAGLFALYNINDADMDKAELELEIETRINENGLQSVNGAAAGASVYAYGLGREIAAKSFEDEIEYSIYSAVMDGGTCEECAPLDGQIHDINDTRYTAPNPQCQGGSKCRCVNLYVAKGMVA